MERIERLKTASLAVIVTGSLAAGAAARADEKPAAPAPGAVAIIGDTAITAAQLDEAMGSRLFEMRTREYNMKGQFLKDLIARKLMEKEAAARGISLEELTRVEIDAKVAAVTDEDKKAFYEKNKPRFGETPEAAALEQIANGLRQQRVAQRRSEFEKELRGKASVRILLEPPRAEVAAAGNPERGPKDAPVTIIEFSDFQCPYCGGAEATLKQLEEHYAGKLRIVFRDFPLPMHKDAPKAAEAAACANEQGRFWEMHDKLFGNQGALKIADLKKRAMDLGLEAAQFDTCLDSGKYAAEWKRDMDEGTRHGVSGTPAFFINGRMLTGAQPYENFAQVIDEELERATLSPLPESKPGPAKKAEKKPKEKKGS